MIDLFSIVFSTLMVLFVVFRAIKCESPADKGGGDKTDLGALEDMRRRMNRGHTT